SARRGPARAPRPAAVTDGGEVSHPKAGAGARKLEEQAAEQLRETLAAAAGAPPSTGELIASSGLDSSLVHRALGSLEKQGLVRRIGADFYFDVSALAAFEQAVRARLVDGPATAAELKDAMGTSRKYAIPLLEYFDSQAVTRREGDTRVPGGR
ncbi:SelB C-terminal domain-containing protein, partial [Eggerthella sp.]|uniref:SelB domain-containing protein n=1 Tax=Eggerthella sp. TaxID=1929886 RepID=UPI00283B5B8A